MFDSHCHTDFSIDAHSTVEEMVRQAERRGVQEITITDHLDLAGYFQSSQLDEAPEMQVYLAEIKRMQRVMQDKIKVHCGIEIGLMDESIERTTELLAPYQDELDFVIASVHVMSSCPILHIKSNWQGISKQRGVELYIGQMIRNIKAYQNFDICGHLTYMSRYAPYEGKEREIVYRDGSSVFDELFQYLIENGKGIEINTSTFHQYEFFMPGKSIISRYRKMGGEIITMGSDAHRTEDIAQHFYQAKQLLKEIGFTYICTFENRTPTFHPIEL